MLPREKACSITDCSLRSTGVVAPPWSVQSNAPINTNFWRRWMTRQIPWAQIYGLRQGPTGVFSWWTLVQQVQTGHDLPSLPPFRRSKSYSAISVSASRHRSNVSPLLPLRFNVSNVLRRGRQRFSLCVHCRSFLNPVIIIHWQNREQTWTYRNQNVKLLGPIWKLLIKAEIWFSSEDIPQSAFKVPWV